MAKGPIPPMSKRPPPAEAPNADIAPWMGDGLPALSTHGLTSSSFFNDGSSKAQPSPSFRPDSGRTADSESPDPMFMSNDRRPSLASATTIDSQNSLCKASTSKGTPYKKVTGFFGDEYRQSPRSSDTNIPSTVQREQTASSRHGSSHTSRDEGRPISPSSSRPRTPLPSSDVVPWVFQDFTVSLGFPCASSSPSILAISAGTAPACLYLSSRHSIRSIFTVPASIEIYVLISSCLLFFVRDGEALLSQTNDRFVIIRVRHSELNCRDTSCFRSRDSPLIRWADRKFHITAMLLLGKRQLALTSSGL